MLTREAAIAAVEGCKSIISDWERWSPTEDQKHLYNNMWLKPLGGEAVQALSVLTDMFFTNNIAQDAWQIALSVDRLREELRRWLVDRDAAGDGRNMPANIDPRGSPEMWRAYQDVLHVVSTRRKTPPPSAKIQKEQGANARSIAMRFGWWRGPDEPDIERVMRELSASPQDEEYDPSTWVHPRELQKHKEIEAEWNARCERLEGEISATKAPKRRREPCKETVEELAQMRGMTTRQIAILKCMTEQQVQVELAHLGMYLGSDGLHQNRNGRDPSESREDALRDIDPHDECGDDVDARIIAIHQDGVRSRDICKKLTKSLGMVVTAQKVGRVINEYKRRELIGEELESVV